MALEVGQKAPDFTLKDPEGNDVSLSDFADSKNVVLVFFPFAFSGVCTDQFTKISENADRYASEQAQVIGISVDSRYSQGVFAEQIGLADALFLADFEPKGAIAREYGTYLDFGFSGRATFVIDKQGVIKSIHRTDTPATIPDEQQYFATLASCNS